MLSRTDYTVMLALALVLMPWQTPAAPDESDVALQAAPELGPEPYSIHFAGPMREALDKLREITGRPIFPTGGPLPLDAPVTLDFDDQPLKLILVELCRQVGCVYEVVPGGDFVGLAPGDPNVDSRPHVSVGDYVLRITGATLSSTWSHAFGWGKPSPESPTITDQFTLQLLVTPGSEEAREVLAGADAHFRAELDTGQVLEADSPGLQMGAARVLQAPDFGSRHAGHWPVNVLLSMPPQGARRITQLEGNLRLYTSAPRREFRFTADEIGRKLEQDGTSATLEDISREEGALRVSITSSPAGGVGGTEWVVLLQDSAELRLLVADGRQVAPSSTSLSTDEQALRLEATFPGVTEFQAVIFSRVLRSAPDVLLPFTITDIPIPG